jgi:hypothetical protein
MSRGTNDGCRRSRMRRCDRSLRTIVRGGDCGDLRMRVGDGTTRECVGVISDSATNDDTNVIRAATTRRRRSWCCILHGGLATENILWGLTFEEDVGLEIVSRLEYMEVRRARGAARERWTDDGLVGRFGSHGSRRWCCEDVKIWGVGDWAKHGIRYRVESRRIRGGERDEGRVCKEAI